MAASWSRPTTQRLTGPLSTAHAVPPCIRATGRRRTVLHLRRRRRGRGPDFTNKTIWITSIEAAAILGVSPRRVRQLANKGYLPYEKASPRRFKFRKAQVEVIANARDHRWWEMRARAQDLHGAAD